MFYCLHWIKSFKYSCFISLQQLIHVHRDKYYWCWYKDMANQKTPFFICFPFFLHVCLSRIQIPFMEQLPWSASNSLITARVNGHLKSKLVMLIWCRDETSCWSLWKRGCQHLQIQIKGTRGHNVVRWWVLPHKGTDYLCKKGRDSHEKLHCELGHKALR